MRKIIFALLIPVIIAAGCVAQYAQSGGPGAVASQNVSISSFAFSPAELTISAGGTVTWTNMDAAPHTVTSDTGAELASGTLAQGQSFSHTFNTPGTFDYHCALHPAMKAKIIVQ